ncbi:cation-transporting P-type ATPase [Candidatus Bipolaricaulota bacterium]|nr:cation-transporting P-type ATPase [Candidatus Bipolaricaulota bacterium]
MVLTDDNYASIVAAVEQGRIIYANIRKTIFYLLSCNVAEIAILFLATLFGWPPPLTAIQLLWLNLATDGAPALALAMEPGEPGIMSRPPRSPLERILNRRSSMSILFQAGLLTVVVLAAFGIARQGNWSTAAGTLAFATLAIAELIRAYAARSEKVPLAKLGWDTNRWMHRAVLSSLALIAIVLFIPPLRTAFGTAPTTALMWAVILPMSILPAVAIEIRKRLAKTRT